jgi:hypothetical protein
MITKDKEQRIQNVAGISIIKVGSASPEGYSLYKVSYWSGEHTVRNLKEKAGVFVGSLTPSPERYSL